MEIDIDMWPHYSEEGLGKDTRSQVQLKIKKFWKRDKHNYTPNRLRVFSA